jgi:hypothetical protein
MPLILCRRTMLGIQLVCAAIDRRAAACWKDLWFVPKGAVHPVVVVWVLTVVRESLAECKLCTL